MNKVSDYIFDNSWQVSGAFFESYKEYVVLRDVGDLRTGEAVKFIGFSDVDNHFGIFVFVNTNNEVLEVRGDFSGHESLDRLISALSKR